MYRTPPQYRFTRILPSEIDCVPPPGVTLIPNEEHGIVIIDYDGEDVGWFNRGSPVWDAEGKTILYCTWTAYRRGKFPGAGKVVGSFETQRKAVEAVTGRP